MKARSTAPLLTFALLVATTSAHAVVLDVAGSVTLEFPGDAGPGLSLSQPITTSSNFDLQTGFHTLMPIVVGVEASAEGAVDSGLYRLPYLERLRVDATALRAGIIALSGSVTGLELDLLSLSLEASDVYTLSIQDQTDRERVQFASVELGGTTASQPGEIEETHSPIGTAALASSTWNVTQSSLGPYGDGTLDLEVPITITSSVQSGDPLTGVATISLSFVPEPDFASTILVGSCLLAAVTRRRVIGQPTWQSDSVGR